MRISIAFIIVLIAVFFAPTAHATYISMETGFEFRDDGHGLILRLTTRNKGDEPAYAVQFEASLGKVSITGKTIPRLSVNEKAGEEFEIKDAFMIPGHYPLIIKTHYQDANSYRFSSLTLGYYDHKTPVISNISVRGEELDVSANGGGKLKFILRNSGDQAHMLTLDLHVPNELASIEGTRTLRIGPKSEETIAFTVKNFSALENSSYAVFLLAQYQHDEKHNSTSGSTIVHISPMSSGLTPSLWLLITSGAVIVLGLAIFLIRRRGTAKQLQTQL
ncbi:MAG: hypothetical protein B6245_07750 [Desulfobacteraceae bacterium 4572_88]|nr:MAG: hypothetical protein B6245_07750 [Desulfobacteraceae bacterium 4572_88]